ncbi:GNAT family N-acetyltransferase [Saxibacter everestensis]|uniref:GNAT family N-acetyltransferase n=1 Tax=Saxibacter everestensis TaxID=2909229 RepID=A0ABY8QRV6_9MICO|nr:GNAT family N-acetyltransferase [Brevibacteriaceae bacterium ZFBP1038]
MTTTTSARLRRATIDDIPGILGLIHELAVYEKEPDAVNTTEEDLRKALFGADPAAFAHVVEVDGEPVAMALWFLNFSTWEGVHGIYLEDLFVKPEHRGAGYGKLLLKTLAELCVERGYARLEWSVLNWNEPSIGFYKSLGAVPQDEWTTFRLTGDSLTSLGS